MKIKHTCDHWSGFNNNQMNAVLSRLQVNNRVWPHLKRGSPTHSKLHSEQNKGEASHAMWLCRLVTMWPLTPGVSGAGADLWLWAGQPGGAGHRAGHSPLQHHPQLPGEHRPGPPGQAGHRQPLRGPRGHHAGQQIHITHTVDYWLSPWQGRLHVYEGYPLWMCTLPVRIMKLLGVKMMIVSNAVGGLNPSYKVGDLMLVKDHINFLGLAGDSPLRGPNDIGFGPRFFSINNLYDQKWRRMALEVAKEVSHIHVQKQRVDI